MSRSGNRDRRPWARALVTAASLALCIAAGPAPDTVTLHDGSEVACRVLTLDARQLVIEKPDGARQNIPRADVRAIAFGAEAVPPIAARVRVFDGDDVVRIFLDGTEVAPPAELKSKWIDLAPLLRDGPNELTAEVRNDSGPWACRWSVEAGAQKEVLACGIANRSGCREQGGNGLEKGTSPAGRVYLYVPPVKPPSGKSLLREPEALRVVDQNLDARAPPVPEHEHRPGHRIGTQYASTQHPQTVDPPAEIGGLRRKEDLHLCEVAGYVKRAWADRADVLK